VPRATAFVIASVTVDGNHFRSGIDAQTLAEVFHTGEFASASGSSEVGLILGTAGPVRWGVAVLAIGLAASGAEDFAFARAPGIALYNSADFQDESFPIQLGVNFSVHLTAASRAEEFGSFEFPQESIGWASSDLGISAYEIDGVTPVNFVLGGIEGNPMVVPEPSTAVTLVIGLAGIWLRSKRSRHARHVSGLYRHFFRHAGATRLTAPPSPPHSL
jgi:hypothetical protein